MWTLFPTVASSMTTFIIKKSSLSSFVIHLRIRNTHRFVFAENEKETETWPSPWFGKSETLQWDSGNEDQSRDQEVADAKNVRDVPSRNKPDRVAPKHSEAQRSIAKNSKANAIAFPQRSALIKLLAYVL